jgi:hypothetical protein
MKQYGLTIPELYIENISLPPAVEEALDKRTSLGLAGDLGKFTQYSAAEAMTSAASNPAGRRYGCWAWCRDGHGDGRSDGTRRPVGCSPCGKSTATTAPPVEHVWHIAAGGEVTGPFSKAAMGRMVTDGKLSRDSMVWTQGQDGWMQAGEVMELAQLFTVMPPPPPGA